MSWMAASWKILAWYTQFVRKADRYLKTMIALDVLELWDLFFFLFVSERQQGKKSPVVTHESETHSISTKITN